MEPDPLYSSPIPNEKPIEVDARGMFCPRPLTELGQSMRSHPTQELFLLIATDPGVDPDLRSWTRGWGHRIVAARRVCSAAEQTEYRFWVRRGTR